MIFVSDAMSKLGRCYLPNSHTFVPDKMISENPGSLPG